MFLAGELGELAIHPLKLHDHCTKEMLVLAKKNSGYLLFDFSGLAIYNPENNSWKPIIKFNT